VTSSPDSDGTITHGEGIGRITTEARGLRQARDQIKDLEDRAGPAMREQQRHRRRAFAGGMQEVQIDAVQRHAELREGIGRRLLCAPVEPVLPIAEQAARVRNIGAVGPGGSGARSGRRAQGGRADRPAAVTQIQGGEVGRHVRLRHCGFGRCGTAPGAMRLAASAGHGTTDGPAEHGLCSAPGRPPDGGSPGGYPP
jgi:hypothetical protein